MQIDIYKYWPKEVLMCLLYWSTFEVVGRLNPIKLINLNIVLKIYGPNKFIVFL